MTAGERMWLWSQPLVAALALAAAAIAWYLRLIGDLSALPTLQSLVTGSFVLPGLALSLLINHVAVSLRRPPMLTVGEKLLLVVEFAIVGAILAISPSADLLFLGYLLWPLLIAAAATAFATMVSTTIRSRSRRALDDTLDPAHDDTLSDGIDDAHGTSLTAPEPVTPAR